MTRLPNFLKLFVVLILSTPIHSVDTPKIDIISAITQLMIPKTANHKTLNPLSVSEAFEGCIFKPYEYPPCSNSFCEKFRSKDDIFNQSGHYRTKCHLTHKNKSLVEKNLPRDYRMDIKMHGPRCCVYAVEIDGEYPNHLTNIINDSNLEWTPIRCEEDERAGSWERWYEISSPKKGSLYAKVTSSSGSGGTWGFLAIYWELPKNFPPLANRWRDKCTPPE